MDIPVHVAAAAYVCNATLYIDSRFFQKLSPSRRRIIALGTVCFVLSLFSHLLLDAVPHYDFVYKVVFTSSKLPFILRGLGVLFKVTLLTLPVIIMSLYVTRDHVGIILVSLVGGIYPDIEKAAYLIFHIPRFLVIFRHHSCSYSPTGLESEHKLFLVGVEVCVFIALLVGLYWVARCRTQSGYISSHNERSSSLTFGLFFK